MEGKMGRLETEAFCDGSASAAMRRWRIEMSETVDALAARIAKVERTVDALLPSLTSLRGIAPGITGGLSSEEFVRKLRTEGGEAGVAGQEDGRGAGSGAAAFGGLDRRVDAGAPAVGAAVGADPGRPVDSPVAERPVGLPPEPGEWIGSPSRAGESAAIKVAIERVEAGEAPRAVAIDKGWDSDALDGLDRLRKPGETDQRERADANWKAYLNERRYTRALMDRIRGQAAEIARLQALVTLRDRELAALGERHRSAVERAETFVAEVARLKAQPALSPEIRLVERDGTVRQPALLHPAPASYPTPQPPWYDAMDDPPVGSLPIESESPAPGEALLPSVARVREYFDSMDGGAVERCYIQALDEVARVRTNLFTVTTRAETAEAVIARLQKEIKGLRARFLDEVAWYYDQDNDPYLVVKGVQPAAPTPPAPGASPQPEPG